MKQSQFDFSNRVKKLREILSLDKKKGILFSDLKDIFYFTGFKGTKGYLLITGGNVFLITDFRYFEKFLKDNCYGELFKVQSSYFDDIAGLIFSLKLKEVILDESKITCEVFNELSSRLPEISFQFKKSITSELRIIKDFEEIEILKEGAQKTVAVFEKFLSFVEIGKTERELADTLFFLLKEEGFGSFSFPPMVLFGKNSSMPHGEPNNTPLTENTPVLIDFGGIHKGYCTDFTRTVFFGVPNSSFVNIYEKLLLCQKESIKQLKCGMKGFQLDAVARQCLEKQSLGEFFKHSLGHGIGLDIHEPPVISPFSDIIIENNMVFTIEPGVYFEGNFGIRIEDMVMVENGLSNVLTDFPKELILIRQE